MSFLKHNSTNRKSNTEGVKKADPVKVVVTGPEYEPEMPPASMQHDINHVEGIEGIEGSLDWIAKGLARLTNQDYTRQFDLGTRKQHLSRQDNADRQRS